MIISRSPFRISLMGGGSDLPSFYQRHGGKCISFTINKFVYVATNPSFHHRYKFSYSKIEEVQDLGDVEHPIIKELLKDYPLPFIDFAAFADVPAGTGLGSSSAFTAATALNFAAYNEVKFPKIDLANYCCRIEIDRLREPIGKQDQYATCIGGLNLFEFKRDETVSITKLSNVGVGSFLERHLSLVYTGIIRKAKKTLIEQSRNYIEDTDVASRQLDIVSMVDDMREAIDARDDQKCGELLHENWELKKQLASNITAPSIDKMYAHLLALGAHGGKILGAGSGGFIAVFHEEGFREVLLENNYQVLDYRFWPDGAEIIDNDRATVS